MKKFKYEARDQSTNKVIKSTVQADSESSAGKLLISQGYTPLKIKEVINKDGTLFKLTNRISTKERVVFIRQLATLIGAGLPITQSFQTVYDQTTNKRLQAIIGEITTNVEGGKSLASSFAQYPKLFNEVFISLITAGESSGTLDVSLNRIANQQEKDSKALSKIRGAMIYPIIVLVVMLAVLGFMLVSIVPQVERLYKDLGKELPLLSRIMVDSAYFSVNYWWLVLIVILVVFISIRQFIRTQKGIELKDSLKLKMPIFKKLLQNLYMARFTRTSQTLLASGVTMLDMLRITSKSVNNIHIERAINRASEKVRGGKTLSQALQNEAVFSRFVPQMIGIGEQSGKIDEMMGKVADVYENDLDQSISNISVTIEPVLMVFLAVFAGLIIAAVLFPVYSLVGTLQIK